MEPAACRASASGIHPSTTFVPANFFSSSIVDFPLGKFRIPRILGLRIFSSSRFLFLSASTAKHGGRLPLRIRAVKEGTVVKSQNALITIENTDPEFYWLTNWAETVLLQVWYPITVTTLSRAIKQVIGKALVRTGDPSLLRFKLHDFGFRGVSSKESVAIGGAAHLLNFLGTDTLATIHYNSGAKLGEAKSLISGSYHIGENAPREKRPLIRRILGA
jgi:Nicotinate phosphoribosyltransferase (NAPRTase) family